MPHRAALSQISAAKSQKETPQELYNKADRPENDATGAPSTRSTRRRCAQAMRWISTICCSKAFACSFTIRPRAMPGTAA